MKVKKHLIACVTIGILLGICLISAEFNLKYMAAEVIFRTENSINSGIVFSKKSGFYDEDFYLSLYAPTDEIYYTLDGSEPTKDSHKYGGPLHIFDASQKENTNSMRTDLSSEFLAANTMYKVPDYLIDKCTILKVAYYDREGNKSKAEEQVYFVGFDEKKGYNDVNIISIVAEPDALFSDERGIYVLGDAFEEYKMNADYENIKEYAWEANYKNSGIEWERPAYIHIFNTKRDLVLSQLIGIRIQGGVSRSFYPKSLNIYARNEYGNNQLSYDFFGTGYYPQRVTLSSGGNDYYGKMKDRLGAELSQELNFSTMHYMPYVLFLNGEYWGFYYLTEKYDENYVEHYYNINKDNVIMIKQGGLEAGFEEDYSIYEEMRSFIESADMKNDENFQKACNLIDMESFIDYYAAEIYMARNGDWPSANYALWRSREISEKIYEDGKWRWMLFDVNTSALDYKLIEHDTIAYVMKECEMFANLSNNEQFKELFSKRVREMRDVFFEENIINTKLDEYKLFMSEPMETHYRRFFGVSNDEFHNRRRRIREFAYSRKEFIEIMLGNNGFI